MLRSLSRTWSTWKVNLSRPEPDIKLRSMPRLRPRRRPRRQPRQKPGPIAEVMWELQRFRI
eukprot:11240277-Heterocapsa_arctica.AAC.1